MLLLIFGQIIFNCPALEKLTSIFCSRLFPFNFHAPDLKCLHQVCYHIPQILIQPAQKTIEYSHVLVEDPLRQNYPMWSRFSIAHLKLESSIVYSLCLQLVCSNRLYQPLPYLNTLNIWDLNFADLSEVSCLLCLIRSAPNLCKLHIPVSDMHFNSFCISIATVQQIYNIFSISTMIVTMKTIVTCDVPIKRISRIIGQNILKIVLLNIDHLEIVTFRYFSGLKTETEFDNFQLGHSRLLKTMSIHRSIYIKEDVALTMAEENMQ